MTTASAIYSAVSSHYSQASAGRTKSGAYETTVAQAFGYTPEELVSIPADANLGLSCGNPLVLAALREGETVVDLGSGAGFDVFLASPKVGKTGQAIGVDMNKDMLAKAERNKKAANEKGQAENVRFVEAAITDIKPLESGTVDCVISNCVVNLVPEQEKPLVFSEVYRLLKPGGRLAISDILIRDGMELPAELKSDMALYVGCIAGASLVSQYERYLRSAGFENIVIVDNGKDLNVYNADVGDDGQGTSGCETTAPAVKEQKSCCGTAVPVPREQKSCCGTSVQTNGSSCAPKEAANGTASAKTSIDLRQLDFNKFCGSFNIYAVKV